MPDLVITDGSPFEVSTNVLYTMIDGELLNKISGETHALAGEGECRLKDIL